MKSGLLGSEAGKGRLSDLGSMFANEAKTVYSQLKEEHTSGEPFKLQDILVFIEVKRSQIPSFIFS